MRLHLIVITTLALILVSVTAGMVYFMQKERVPLYDSGDFSGSTVPYQLATSTYPSAPNVTSGYTTAGDILISNWQDSGAIRHAPYASHTATATTQAVTTSTPETRTNTPPANDSTNDGFDIWGWLPGLRGSSNAPPATAELAELTVYHTLGNALGGIIKQFAVSVGDQPQILDSFVQDRTQTLPIQHLATQYTQVASDITTLDIPTPFYQAIQDLSQSYRAVGERLLALSQTTSDSATLREIYAYNAAVDEFAEHFLHVSNLFGAYGVTFSTGEGGDIFAPPVR